MARGRSKDPTPPDEAADAALSNIITPQTGVGGNSAIDPALYHWMNTMIEASEKRTDSKIDTLESRIDAKLGNLPTLGQLIGSLAVTAIAIIGVAIGIIALGSARFDSGTQFAGGIVGQTLENKRLNDENAKQVLEIRRQQEENAKQFGLILELLRRQLDQSPSREKRE
jgi:hypothetical protein